MARHLTMGGVRINPKAGVIDRNGGVMPGLYAADGITGGNHGSNRDGGNATGEPFTFGRIAGESVSAWYFLTFFQHCRRLEGKGKEKFFRGCPCHFPHFGRFHGASWFALFEGRTPACRGVTDLISLSRVC